MPLTKASRQHLEAKWPSIVDNHVKRASLRGPDEAVDDKITVKVFCDQDDVDVKECVVPLNLKVFIGFEYECPRGHRFMVSAPDRSVSIPLSKECLKSVNCKGR